MLRAAIIGVAGTLLATSALSIELGELSKSDLVRVDRQCDALRFRQPTSLASDTPPPPAAGETVADPSSYWADSANGVDEALSRVDLSSLTVEQCREAGFYKN